MTTLVTRIRNLYDVEGFWIIVKRGGKDIPLNENGVLGPYPYEKAAKGSWSVQEWKEKKFSANYDELTCDVLLGDESIADDTALLSDVRASYEEA